MKTDNKKLRLLLTTKCPNKCPMCCNNSWDFSKLPVVERWNYEQIMFTGGEPLLYPSNVDRLAISCVMEIDSTGEVVEYDIFESVIKSNIQMTYKKVNAILEKNEIAEGYEPYVEKLHLMSELADILRKNKVSKGYIDFDLTESKIIVDDNGKAIDVTL